MFKCQVCQKHFDDLWEHLTGNKGSGFLTIKDKKHRKYMEHLSKQGYHDHACFCGGQILQRNYGENNWENTCSQCNFLYDED